MNQNYAPAFPKMIIIGAAKCGTTSTHHYLRQHPRISLPWRKETHFFIADENGIDPVREYLGKIYREPITNAESYFAEFNDPTPDSIRVEVCPSYILVPNAPKNIHRLAPNSVIVALLRDPVERFFSDYKFMTMNGELNSESRVFDPNRFNLDVLALRDGNSSIKIQGIFERGNYATELARYRDLFAMDSIRVHLYEELQNNPNALMNALISYIGLEPFTFDTQEKFMVSGTLRGEGIYKLLKESIFAKGLMKLLPTRLYQKVRGNFEATIIKKVSHVPQPGLGILRALYKDEMIRLREDWGLAIDHWIEPVESRLA